MKKSLKEKFNRIFKSGKKKSLIPEVEKYSFIDCKSSGYNIETMIKLLYGDPRLEVLLQTKSLWGFLAEGDTDKEILTREDVRLIDKIKILDFSVLLSDKIQIRVDKKDIQNEEEYVAYPLFKEVEGILYIDTFIIVRRNN